MADKFTKTGKFGKLGTVPLTYAQIPGYRLIREIGRGGMSLVYLADEENSNHRIALKLILPGKELDDYSKTGFIREIEHLKVLDHPNIVHIYNSGYSGGKLFLALEYCNSGTLREWLHKNRNPLSISEAVAITLKMLDALEYAHKVYVPGVELETGETVDEQGLVHRDIKPENIFICKVTAKDEYIVKVGDFGLSKVYNSSGLSGKTMTGSFGGTPGFMSRQQLLNYKYVKPEVDIWASAACLYYMLTLTTPRELDNRNSYDSLVRNDPIPIQQRDASIPDELAELLDRTLMDDKELYFKTAEDFKSALLECQQPKV